MASIATMDTEDRLRREGRRLIAGADEVGRGSIAGPVVAAAVIMPAAEPIAGVADSKALSPVQREEFDLQVRRAAVAVGVGVVSAALIDATDILRATHVAIRIALRSLSPAPDFIVIDGRPVPDLCAPSEAIVGGDRLCYSIAAASIVAKVYRDRVMMHLEALYPGYGLAEHKGYVTAGHREAVERMGPSPVHRLSFEPLRSLGQKRMELG